MTAQEFNNLKVGDKLGNNEIIHKYKEFLIVKSDDGHDLLDLAKINKLGLKSTPETFLGLKIGRYDYIPVEVDNDGLAYLLEVTENDVIITMGVDKRKFHFTPSSIKIL
jgi:hypothetical protein